MAKELLANALSEALARAQQAGEIPTPISVTIDLQAPRDTRHGDLSTSLPLVVASATGGKPRDLAQVIVKHLQLPEGLIAKVDIAGPGFINFTLAPEWLRDVVRHIQREGEDYGRSNAGAGRACCWSS